MLLGKELTPFTGRGEGGKERNVGKAGGFWQEVYRGSKRMDAGVAIFSRIYNASTDPCFEAVVNVAAAKLKVLV